MKLGIVTLLLAGTFACGASRTTFARYPGAPAAFDAAASDPKAVELATKVFAAAGGPGNWDKAHMIHWLQATTQEGKPTGQSELSWDRWDARQWTKVKQADHYVVTAYDIYGTFSMGHLETEKGMHQALVAAEVEQAVAITKKSWHVDTAIMCLPFLLMEPGAKLTYVGPIKDGDTEYEQIKLAFAPADTARAAGFDFDIYVDKTTNLIHRVDYIKPTGEHYAYAFSDWTTVGGLKFATKRTNVGANEVITISNIDVGEPDDRLYVPSVS
jgi:hypothetical protein